MLVENFRKSKKLLYKLMREQSANNSGRLLNVVKETMLKRQSMLTIASEHQTPFYVFDQKSLQNSIDEFINAFKMNLKDFKTFYAVKSNPHPLILKMVLHNNLGLDVSSARELLMGLSAGAKELIFSGPGKTLPELKLALRNKNKVIVMMDSFGELRRLGYLNRNGRVKIRAGVRVFTKFHGEWSKFGIDLKELVKFWNEAKRYPGIELQGLQCHMSLNFSADKYQLMIEEIAKYLKNNFNANLLEQIKFIDLGGGFWPHLVDGEYPWSLPQGEIIKIANEFYKQDFKFIHKYYLTKADTLKSYAAKISSAIKKNFSPLIDCQYFFEPGRIISTQAMHLVMRIVDIKKKNLAILDGGINMVGWDCFIDNYYPVINLTHPGKKEINCDLFGPLCLPQDFWSHYCYASKLKEGDIILIPNQGAYTYTWAQNFIKPIPKVYPLK